MKTHLIVLVALAIAVVSLPAIAQEPVIGVTGAEADALFTSKNPRLNSNKQAAIYHIMQGTCWRRNSLGRGRQVADS